MNILITVENSNRRLDKFLFAYLNNAPHSLIYKLLRKKRIKLNASKASGNEILQIGDELKLYISEETIRDLRTAKVFKKAKPLTGIIFEDENLLIVNKPAGLPSQGGAGDINNDHLLARVLFYLQENKSYDSESSFTPALCNRLDVNTSGLVVCGKNLFTLQKINLMFKNQEIDRVYHAVVDGIVGEVGDNKTLEGIYNKDEIRNIAKISLISTETKKNETIAITSYEIKAVFKNHTLLEVRLVTGRSHQIRAHLASIGHPLTGDKKYGGSKSRYSNSQLLHCYKIKIPTGETFEAPLPKNFKKFLEAKNT